MLVSPAVLASTTEPVQQPEVLITPQQVLFSTAAAAGVQREHAGPRLVAVVRRMFAASTQSSREARPPRPPRQRPRYQAKRYAYIEHAAMARAMERL
jgi:hypothetical protein